MVPRRISRDGVKDRVVAAELDDDVDSVARRSYCSWRGWECKMLRQLRVTASSREAAAVPRGAWPGGSPR